MGSDRIQFETLICETCDEEFRVSMQDYYAGSAIDHASGKQLCPMHMVLAHQARVAVQKLELARKARERVKLVNDTRLTDRRDMPPLGFV